MGRGAPQTRQHTSDECSYTGYCPDLVTRPVWSNSSASIHGKKRNERTSTPSPRTRRHRLDFGPMKVHHIPRLPRNFSARLTGMSQLGAASSSYSLSCCILLGAYVRASMEDPYHPDLYLRPAATRQSHIYLQSWSSQLSPSNPRSLFKAASSRSPLFSAEQMSKRRKWRRLVCSRIDLVVFIRESTVSSSTTMGLVGTTTLLVGV
jgi:hypothetical protein